LTTHTATETQVPNCQHRKKNNAIHEGYTSVFTLLTANIHKCTQNIINQGQALSFILGLCGLIVVKQIQATFSSMRKG